MADPITVVVVDDDQIVRDSLMTLLRVSPGIRPVAEFEDGGPAVEFAGSHTVDVYLVDLAMPTMNGYATTDRLQTVSPSSSVIILTSLKAPGSEKAVTRIGASAMVRKSALPYQIVSTIRAVHAGSYTPGGPLRAAPCAPPQFTARETEILRLLGKGMANQEISDSMVLSQSAVKKHLTAILGKLEAQSRLEAVIKAIELGIIDLRKVDGRVQSFADDQERSGPEPLDGHPRTLA